MREKIIIFILFTNLFSCSKKAEHSYTFYYWKTKLSLNSEEKEVLNKATTPILYTRFFDVDKIDGKFEPVGIINKDSSFVSDKKIVPVVFITNQTFLNIEKKEIPILAKSVSDLVKNKAEELQLNILEEIQIDCDWTAGTKNDFFQFLKELQQYSGKEITSTLRLHQVKDKEKMGIPPVKKVYLMCYSTSSPLENSDKNSILDVGILKTYLAQLEKYPIKNIDVALPIYSWGIITNHLGKHKLINAISTDDLKNPDFEKISDNEVKILKDGFYFGYFLNKGFRIKVEQISKTQLEQTQNFLDQNLENYSIIYYQLDRKFVKNPIF